MTPQGYQQFEINTADFKTQEAAERLTKSLLSRMDIARVASVLGVALAKVFGVILHTSSPMPETNLASMRDLVRMLTTAIDDHEQCCKSLGTASTDTKPTVH